MTPPLRTALLAALLAFAGPAPAHDTWFAPLPSPAGEAQFALGTGNRFPATELAVDPKFFTRAGCRGADGRAHGLQMLRYTDTTTLLRVPSAPRATLACFVQLEPFEFELPAERIEVYFAEIRPSAAVLAAWTGLRARGLPFLERYTKSARIDGADAAPRPVGTAMDVLRESPAGALAAGTDAVFQVLRDGRPLADFNVELVHEGSATPQWLRTDAQGRVRARLPQPGRWLLRGTDLRLRADDPTRWDSQFITYAFDVAR
jgi:Domain of unknown function (DUF4198)